MPPSASSGSSPVDGAEPINFRAALAAFEGNAAASAQLHAPVARSLRATNSISNSNSNNRPQVVGPKTQGIHSDATASGDVPWRNAGTDQHTLDPVSRSNSTPKIRDRSIGQDPHLESNPFAQEEPAMGGGSLLKAPWPALHAADGDASRLRKTGSGTSLRDLMQKSLPDGGLNRSRSKSLAGRATDSHSASGRSTPTSTANSGTNSPRLRVRNIIALYGANANNERVATGASTSAIGGSLGGGTDLLYGGSLRTSSPTSMASQTPRRSRHMLDASNDDDRWDPLFGHAVMQPRPKSSSGLQSAPVSYPNSPQPTGSTASASVVAPASALAQPPAPPPFARTVSSSQIFTTRTPLRTTLQPPSRTRRDSYSSASSTVSAGPRLPPRPPSGSTGPLISEFGQISMDPAPAYAKGPFGPPTADTGHNITYATYTPGARRNGQTLSSGGGGEVGKAPPALPPRSATVGQPASLRSDLVGAATAEDSQLAYAFRTRLSASRQVPKSPSLPSGVLALPESGKAERPEPPPRPRMFPLAQHAQHAQPAAGSLDGNAGGFRFGGTSADPNASQASPGKSRVAAQTHHRSSLRGLGSDPTPSLTTTGPSATPSPSPTSTAFSASTRGTAHSHAKSPSNVFTSISLSDDASRELRGSLESDIFQRDAQQEPASATSSNHMSPPPRNRYGHSVNRSIGSAMSMASSPNAGQMSTGKALWESASSALPLPFKASAPGAGSGRALAEGAPSRQNLYAFRAVAAADSASVSQPGELDSSVRPSWAGQLQTRSVQLVAPAARTPPRSATSIDDGARRRYEALFDHCLKAQDAMRVRKVAKLDVEARDFGSVRGKRPSPVKAAMAAFEAGHARDRAASQLSTHSVPSEARDVSSGIGVEAAKGWFEPSQGPQTPTMAGASSPISRSAPPAPSSAISERRGALTLSMGRIRKVWQRSQLSDRVLAEIWDAAVAYQRGSGHGAVAQKGLTREAFVRAMAAIDAELARIAVKRRARLLRQGGHGGTSNNSSSKRAKARPFNGGGAYQEREATRSKLGGSTSRSSSVHSARSARNYRPTEAPSLPSLQTARRSAVGLSKASDCYSHRRSSGDSDGSAAAHPSHNNGYGRHPGGGMRRVPPQPVSRTTIPDCQSASPAPFRSALE